MLWAQERMVPATPHAEGDTMRWHRLLVRWTGVLLGSIVVLAGCTYDAALQRLSPAEQAEFSIYRHVMTTGQVRTYVAQPTTAARTSYLQELGLVQRFEALDPFDQAAIRSGAPRAGMSADALRFLWGEPYATAGDARRYAHWHYLGSSFTRNPSGYRPWDFGNRVDVYLVAGKVVGWVDVPPSTIDRSGAGAGASRLPSRLRREAHTARPDQAGIGRLEAPESPAARTLQVDVLVVWAPEREVGR
jgi:hypothetical protein